MSAPVDFKNLLQAVTSTDVPGELSKWQYGKRTVKVVRIDRSHPEKDQVKEATVEVLLESDCGATYVTGDNSNVIPTDTQKNTVYYFAKTHFTSRHSIEDFGKALAEHFIKNFDFVWKAKITIIQHSWERIRVDGKDSKQGFVRSEPEQRRCVVVLHRKTGLYIQSGFQGLTLLKTAGSSFYGFPRCSLTTLPDAKDRTLCTSATILWTYTNPSNVQKFDKIYDDVRSLTLQTFCSLDSLSVQQLMYQVAQQVLKQVPDIDEVDIHMPNIHLFTFDLSRFGVENKNEVYFPTNDGAAGSIYCTVKRKLQSKL